MRCMPRSERRVVVVGIRWLAVTTFCTAVAGCGHPLETGYADQGKMQIQFYQPPGASVTVKGGPTRTHQVNVYGPDTNRLERTPEEYAVFNLSPGRYEFKYTAAEGLEEVSVYGELEVKRPSRDYAENFMRRSFVPIALPSAYYRRLPVAGDEIFPYRGQAYQTAIDENDLVRIRQGDVIEKVFVVADLERADRVARETRDRLVVLERKLEYAEARFRDAYNEFRLAMDDPVARFFGKDREYIHWEKERLELLDKIDKAQARLRRAEALLRADRVLVRKGMMVVATAEVVEPHEDVVEASDDIGAVLLVMRLGGRHMHWGEPPRELTAFQP